MSKLLKPRFEVRAVDLKPLPDEPDPWQIDLTQLDQLLPALDGIDSLMHFAIAPYSDYDESSREYVEAMFRFNSRGTYHVLEAARQAGVKRVALAGSITVLWGHELTEGVLFDESFPRLPHHVYSAFKCFDETLAEFYARTHSMNVIVWRIGAPCEATDPDSWKGYRLEKDRRALVSCDDIARAFACSMSCDFEGFAALNLTSENENPYLDLSRAEEVCGYRPMHRFHRDGVSIVGDPAPL
ncbi:MAG: NAD(P)-dependent oxidoreductase [Armatimonadetes bacterium]|nr:NAD(P)-dependent oxidoreductase [Armatimonadota bacterium]